MLIYQQIINYQHSPKCIHKAELLGRVCFPDSARLAAGRLSAHRNKWDCQQQRFSLHQHNQERSHRPISQLHWPSSSMIKIVFQKYLNLSWPEPLKIWIFPIAQQFHKCNCVGNCFSFLPPWKKMESIFCGWSSLPLIIIDHLGWKGTIKANWSSSPAVNRGTHNSIRLLSLSQHLTLFNKVINCIVLWGMHFVKFLQGLLWAL